MQHKCSTCGKVFQAWRKPIRNLFFCSQKCYWDPAARFFRFVNKTPECWLWTGKRSAGSKGEYRVMRFDGTARLVHRVSWEIHNGPIPEGICVCHKCDVAICVRPSHLFLGTQKENIEDMMRKGRKPLGELSPHAKLTNAAVIFIKANKSVVNSSDLASRFSVSRTSIQRIWSGKNWSHIK